MAKTPSPVGLVTKENSARDFGRDVTENKKKSCEIVWDPMRSCEILEDPRRS